MKLPLAPIVAITVVHPACLRAGSEILRVGVTGKARISDRLVHGRLTWRDGLSGRGRRGETLQPVSNAFTIEGTMVLPCAATALDITVNPIPADRFLHADVNDDGSRNLSDAIRILDYLFLGTGTVTCLSAADTNFDRKLDLADAVFLFQFLFGRGLPPREPFLQCGSDPEAGGLSCEASACP